MPVAKKKSRRIGDFHQSLPRHFEHADFVRGTEAVFHRTQHTEMVPAFAFEIENRIDQMLDGLGSCDLSVLRHMADEDKSRAGGFRVAHEIVRGGPHLRDRAGGRLKRGSPDRLDGIDGHDTRRRTDSSVASTSSTLLRKPAKPAHRPIPCARHACAPAPSLLRRKYRRLCRPISRTRPAPAELKSICRHRDRRRPGARNPERARRRTPDRIPDAGGPSRRRFIFGLEIFQRERPAAHALDGTCSRRDRSGGDFLDDGVPAAARVAFARPFGVIRAAALANEARLRARH